MCLCGGSLGPDRNYVCGGLAPKHHFVCGVLAQTTTVYLVVWEPNLAPKPLLCVWWIGSRIFTLEVCIHAHGLVAQCILFCDYV